MDNLQKQSHWHEALALTMGILLLVALTGYVGAATTPSNLFAQEDEGPSDDEVRQLKEQKGWLKDNLGNTLRQYKEFSRQVRSKSQGPEGEINRLTKELQQALRSSSFKKLHQDYRADIEKQGKEFMSDVQALSARIKEARQQAKSAFDALTPLYQKVAAIKINAINDLDAFEEARGIQEELQQEVSSIQNDLNNENQEFYNGEYHQKKERIRNLVEIPKQLTDFKKTIERSKKMAAKKSLNQLERLFPEIFTVAALKERVQSFQTQIQAIQDALKSGDVEDLQSQAQELHEAQIFGFEGVVSRLEELGRLLPSLARVKAYKDAKNEELRNSINERVADLIGRVMSGDLDESIHREFSDLINGEQTNDDDRWRGLYDLRDNKLRQKRFSFDEDDPSLDRLRELGKRFEQKDNEEDGSSFAPPPLPAVPSTPFLESKPAE